MGRYFNLVYGLSSATTDPTPKTMRDQVSIVKSMLAPQLDVIERIIETTLPGISRDMDAAGAPWTPRRVPKLKR